jgi:glyoxylase-like metal-dependent hydrolase (beta-lactamase superfamily II)
MAKHSGQSLELRQLFDPASSTYSYLLWDTGSLEAALIDPVREQLERDTRLIRKLGLRLRCTLETHVHADHVTGSGELRRLLNSVVMVHENSHTRCADILLKDGDEITLGQSRIGVLYTPGHTDGDASYLIPGAVFTGDSLLINGCGRTDFQFGDAGTLYDSITRRLFSLPDETIVYPGHDFQGHACSTIGAEKTGNPRLHSGISRDRFIAIMESLELSPPARIREALPANLRCGVQGTGTRHSAVYF